MVCIVGPSIAASVARSGTLPAFGFPLPGAPWPTGRKIAE